MITASATASLLRSHGLQKENRAIPRGDLRGLKNLSTYLSEELDEVITVREGGKVVR